MADTFKFSTFLWFIAGLLIPLWPVSLPVCWFMAYRSYRGGRPQGANLSELQAAVELHKSGNLSDAELASVKAKVLGQKG